MNLVETIFTNPKIIVWAVLWFSLGFGFGRVMKKVDQYLVHRLQIDKTKTVNKVLLWILDALHHFQLGLLLMALSWDAAMALDYTGLAVFLFGFGLVADDAEDWREYVKTFYQYRKLLEMLAQATK
ncbi:MAG: hypothetical protein J7K15_10230 [Deltaproteobacteria bacterium]|nr:hypothetical protein [Deltaproteobacteria bacterium]